MCFTITQIFGLFVRHAPAIYPIRRMQCTSWRIGDDLPRAKLTWSHIPYNWPKNTSSSLDFIWYSDILYNTDTRTSVMLHWLKDVHSISVPIIIVFYFYDNINLQYMFNGGINSTKYEYYKVTLKRRPNINHGKDNSQLIEDEVPSAIRKKIHDIF